MFKIVILEDEDRQAELTVEYLHRYERESGDPINVERYSRAIDFLESYRCDADVVLLDIQVPDMLGIDAARRLRQIDKIAIIMFVTNLDQYAIEGYSVNALDYILKPLSYASFSVKLARALRIVKQRQSGGTMISIKTKSGLHRFPSAGLAYIEVINHTLAFHMTNGTVFKQWGSMATYEELLEKEHFVRCNSGYLVNLKFVESVDGSCVTVKGTPLKISTPRRKEFLKAVAQYKGGGN